jgi:hypothetical protein
MTTPTAARPELEVADIIRQQGEEFLRRYGSAHDGRRSVQRPRCAHTSANRASRRLDRRAMHHHTNVVAKNSLPTT